MDIKMSPAFERREKFGKDGQLLERTCHIGGILIVPITVAIGIPILASCLPLLHRAAELIKANGTLVTTGTAIALLKTLMSAVRRRGG